MLKLTSGSLAYFATPFSGYVPIRITSIKDSTDGLSTYSIEVKVTEAHKAYKEDEILLLREVDIIPRRIDLTAKKNKKNVMSLSFRFVKDA